MANYLTEEEHIKICELADEFWLEFSALCNKYMTKAPPHLKAHYEMFLSEKTSFFGRKR